MPIIIIYKLIIINNINSLMITCGVQLVIPFHSPPIHIKLRCRLQLKGVESVASMPTAASSNTS